MAYRRKTKSRRKTYGRKSYGRKATTRRRVFKRKASPRRRKSSATPRVIRIELVQSSAVAPTLATPATKAAPVRARFGG